MPDPIYATRLNAFRQKGQGIAQMIAAAGRVPGLNAADLNYPDHFDGHSTADLAARLGDTGLALNGLAMRYYTDPGYRLGGFTHPEPRVRRAAIDETRRGLDILAEMGGKVMTIWPGQDGVDYAFQGDHAAMWDATIAALQEICDHNPALDISLEYKPNEPRAFALMPDMATTLLLLDEVARPNTGVTLDFAHSLYAGEIPARSLMLAARRSRVLGVHLNDGQAKRDDGLMVGMVHPVETLELFVALERTGYDGAIYFDTFPDHSGLDPVAEAAGNVAVTNHLRSIARRLATDNALAEAQGRQDAAAVNRIIAGALYGL